MTWVARCAPLLLTLLVAGAARADGAQQSARAAYDRGVAAHKQGDLGRAAEEFARADALAPSPVALGAALDAAVAANRPVLGMELVARAARVASPAPELKRSVEAARAAFAGKTGRVVLVCNEGARCAATLDGAELLPTVERIVRAGEHSLVFRVSGKEESRRVQVAPDVALELHPSAAALLEAPAAAPATPAGAPSGVVTTTPPATSPGVVERPLAVVTPSPEPPTGKPLPRWVVILGGSLTVVAVGGAVWSGATAAGVHNDFDSARCPLAAGPTCADLASQGSGMQTLANVLFMTAGVLGAATVATALFLVDWSSGGERTAGSVRLSPAVGPSGGSLGLHGTF